MGKVYPHCFRRKNYGNEVGEDKESRTSYSNDGNMEIIVISNNSHLLHPTVLL